MELRPQMEALIWRALLSNMSNEDSDEHTYTIGSTMRHRRHRHALWNKVDKASEHEPGHVGKPPHLVEGRDSAQHERRVYAGLQDKYSRSPLLIICTVGRSGLFLKLLFGSECMEQKRC